MRIRLILEIYAILCLVGLPMVLALVIYLYKRTDAIRRLDEWIDSFVGVPQSGGADGSKEGVTVISPEDEARPQESLSHFCLRTGETYRCWGEGSNRFKGWESGYPFLGIVDEDNIFRAAKVGTCALHFNGLPRFVIDILPSCGRSFADEDIEDVIQGAPFAAVKSRLKGRKVIQSDAGDLPLICGCPDRDVIRATYTQSDGTLQKVLYLIGAGVSIEAMMNERFRKMETVGESTVWYHMGEDDMVDALAFAKATGEGVLLGVSRPWRMELSACEAELNAVMVEKSFADLTGVPVSDVRLTGEEEKRITGTVMASNDNMAPSESQEELGTPESAETVDADETSHGWFEPQMEPDEAEAEEAGTEEMEIPDEEEEEMPEEEPFVPGDDLPDMDSFGSEGEEEFYDGPHAEPPSFDI